MADFDTNKTTIICIFLGAIFKRQPNKKATERFVQLENTESTGSGQKQAEMLARKHRQPGQLANFKPSGERRPDRFAQKLMPSTASQSYISHS